MASVVTGAADDNLSRKAKAKLLVDPPRNSDASDRKPTTHSSGNATFATPLRQCCVCGLAKSRSQYSATQWKKSKLLSKCKTCISRKGKVGLARQCDPKKSQPSKTADFLHSQSQSVRQDFVVAQRPQMPVPGFDSLTCCTDWPQTKRGEPPQAQSLVFMPLLAIIHGPLDGFCNDVQISNALRWWSAALPAFPSWLERLLKAGAKERLQTIVGQKNKVGRPNTLIPKLCGDEYGTFPHIKGKIQNRILEMDVMVSIEIYQAVACMYSQKKFHKEVD